MRLVMGGGGEGGDDLKHGEGFARRDWVAAFFVLRKRANSSEEKKRIEKIMNHQNFNELSCEGHSKFQMGLVLL